jgi:hypothetical protein
VKSAPGWRAFSDPAAGRDQAGSKRFFLKKEAKTSIRSASRQPWSQPSKWIKVFWFFFSKKNRFLTPPPPA